MHASIKIFSMVKFQIKLIQFEVCLIDLVPKAIMYVLLIWLVWKDFLRPSKGRNITKIKT